MLFPRCLTLLSISFLCSQLLPCAPPGGLGLQAASAESTSAAKSLFNLPVNSKPARSQGAASRDGQDTTLRECDGSQRSSQLALLLPSQEVAGQTVSAHPSFFWSVSQPISVPIKFSLLRPGNNGIDETVYEKQVSVSKAGIVALDLPADIPELVPGQLYMWTVSLQCNEKRPSANPVYISWVERVAPGKELQVTIDKAANDRDRAIAYAHFGAWYDALAAFYRAKSANPNDPSIEADLSSLLSSVGLQNPATASR
ncbi:DUF928 domain-containing protein [Oscillatoria sp. FACHB-1406]|uniref:DUF928 domain-containing protein n=1 Tax=Oscillatoria sp. FACHB-1406 TaxID=2692846 RepID=UPI001682F687|nr:DUF928 domain-containing protein [Oscillatoria sp. FACHB-1406]MBD2577020.1 DUF928 domain-containing protein [Oscillatoria sp. FACHB-1406]